MHYFSHFLRKQRYGWIVVLGNSDYRKWKPISTLVILEDLRNGVSLDHFVFTHSQICLHSVEHELVSKLGVIFPEGYLVV